MSPQCSRVVLSPEEFSARSDILLSDADKADALSVLQLQVSELAKIRDVPAEELGGRILAEQQYSYVYDPVTGGVRAVLAEPDFREVLYSRTFPLIDDRDIETMRQKTVLFLGCSTNAPVAMALLSQGLGGFILCDFDTIELSNTNRIPATGVSSMGLSKADHLAGILLDTNPYARVRSVTEHCTLEELEQLIKDCDLVFEMTDDPLVKLESRRLAGRLGKPLCMVTGIGDRPLVSCEMPGDRPFLRDFDDREITAFADSDLAIRERFRLYIRIIGTTNLPPETMANMVLAAHGKRRYIAQHGGTAMLGGGLGAYIAREILCGRPVYSESSVDLRHLVSTPEGRDSAYAGLFARLSATYPDIFRKSDGSLPGALSRLVPETFGIDY
jgi:hypothetical protein